MVGFDGITFAVFAALAGLSIVATAVSFFKIVQFSRLGLGGRGRLSEVLEACKQGQIAQALKDLETRRGVLARVVGATLRGAQSHPADADFAEEAGRQAALYELARLSRYMRVLESIVQAAPMLGLLGTVIGMIDAFATLSEATGAVDPALLAAGIYTALTTTAAGLTIAIIFYFVSAWLEGRIDRERLDMELAISTVVHGHSGPNEA